MKCDFIKCNKNGIHKLTDCDGTIHAIYCKEHAMYMKKTLEELSASTYSTGPGSKWGLYLNEHSDNLDEREYNESIIFANKKV